MKVAVIGANGQLGSDLAAAFTLNGDVVYRLTHAEIEIADLESVKASLEANQPEVVVNTAAMHHVDRCESEPGTAYAVNAIGGRNLALVTRSLAAALVHISTDYVFDGNKSTPYEE